MVNSDSNNRYLFLYLALMISIFCVVLVSDGNTSKVSEKISQKSDNVSNLSKSEPILDYEFTIFTSDKNLIDENSYQNLKSLLIGHDLKAELIINSSTNNLEQTIGQALTLQYRLKKENFSSRDVLTQIKIEDDAVNKKQRLILLPDTRIKW